LRKEQGGNKLLQGLRRLDMLDANYQTAILNRWTGEGSTNDYPRLTRDDPNSNYSKMSPYYLQKGDYMRIKLIQLGYTLPKNVSNLLEQVRLDFTLPAKMYLHLQNILVMIPKLLGNLMV
jgi:hypothetical protein